MRKPSDAAVQKILSKPFFHGTTTDINEFSLDFVGGGVDQHGSGFYLTGDYDDALKYTMPRESQPAEGDGIVLELSVSLKNPIIIDDTRGMGKEKCFGEMLYYSQVLELIKHSENQEALWDFGDISYEPIYKIQALAARQYLGYESLIRQLNAISNDFYRGKEGAFLKNCSEITKSDGVIVFNPNNLIHLVVWNPDTIEIKNKHYLKSDQLFSDEQNNLSETARQMTKI